MGASLEGRVAAGRLQLQPTRVGGVVGIALVLLVLLLQDGGAGRVRAVHDEADLRGTPGLCAGGVAFALAAGLSNALGWGAV